MHTHRMHLCPTPTVAGDQLHNFLNFAQRVALRHTRQDRTLQRTAEQSRDIPACSNGEDDTP